MSKEAAVQNAIRLRAAEEGVLLLRQNSGALRDAEGRLVRYGLANESKAMNQQYKSGDLVGVTPLLVGIEHVGMTLGVFTSVEVKRDGWRYTGRGREAAQQRWNDLIVRYGGLAGFADSVETAAAIWRKNGGRQ